MKPITETRTAQLYYYRGRLVDDMTREELIEAVKQLGTQYNEHLNQSMRSWEIMRKLNEARRKG